MRKLILIFTLLAILTGCSSGDGVAMKVNDVVVKENYLSYFEESFNTQSGGTISNDVRKYAFKQAEIYAQFIALTEAMNIDSQPEYEKLINQIKENYGSIEEYMKINDVTEDLFEFVIRGDACRRILLDQFKLQLGITPDIEDQYFRENFWRAKHLLLQTEGKTDAEKAEIKKKVDSLYKQVKNGADFDKLIAEHNEDPGVNANPDGYVFTVGKMVREFQDGVTSIKIGEYNLVETGYGYHIVKRLALDETPELYEKFKEEAMTYVDSWIVMDRYFQEYFWRAKHLLLSTKGKSQSEKAEIKQKAELLYEQIEQGADFDTLIAQYNEDPGMESQPDGYVFTDGEMMAEFQNGVSGIDVGEYNLVETSYGYHIVKRLPLNETPQLYNKFKTDNAQKLQSIDNANINLLFSDYIIENVEQYEIKTRDYTGLAG